MQHPRSALMRQPIALAALIALATLTACGGGSSNSDSGDAGNSDMPPLPETEAVSTRVIDGYLSNVLVCLDTNNNGACDVSEPQGVTGAGGAVTLEVPKGEAGRYPLVAMVTTNSQDESGLPVQADYILKAPADAPAQITPLTTLVQAQVVATGKSTEQAAQDIQNQLALEQSPLQDFIANQDQQASDLARLVAITTQQLVLNTAGATDNTGAPLTAATVNDVIANTLLQQLDILATIISDNEASSDEDLQQISKTLANETKLTSSNAYVIAEQMRQPVVPDTASVPTSTLRWLSYQNASNYTFHLINATAEQNTPDSNGTRYFTEIRRTVANGSAQPWSRTMVGWTDAGWLECPTNYVHEVRTVPNTNATETLYCGVTRSRFQQVGENLANKNVRETVAQIRSSGIVETNGYDYSNWGPDPNLIATDATWPEGAMLFTRTVDTLEGGDYFTGRLSLPPADDPMSTDGSRWRSASLDDFLDWNQGDFAADVTLDTVNGNNSYGVVSQRWYKKSDGSSGYKRYFIGFDKNQQRVRFYQCEGDTEHPQQPRTKQGSCKVLLTSTYKIEPLGSSSRVLRFAAQPIQISQRVNTTLIERQVSGAPTVFRGEHNKASTGRQLRLNTVATEKLLGLLNIEQ